MIKSFLLLQGEGRREKGEEDEGLRDKGIGDVDYDAIPRLYTCASYRHAK